ncbi:MAG TPA: hypothetical protein VMZ03_05865 [Chitinophagaceae bacterium]|nr:hypothetical protein [Chitinophagaceae bacterium]
MRIILFGIATMLLIYGCNSSGKKDPNHAMDDTARMRNPVSRIAPVKTGAADIPASIKVKGTIQEVWKWTDNLGENFLITSYVLPYEDRNKEYDEDGMTAELYAGHYAGKDGSYREVWTMTETERSCPFDLTLHFIPGAVSVTDLDKDNMAETKIQYAIACRSDVSPALMKLAMYENGTRYVLQGSMWLAYSPDQKYEVTEKDVNLEKLPKEKDEPRGTPRSFGRYESEKDFVNAPVEFLNYARSEWLKFSKEKMGE